VERILARNLSAVETLCGELVENAAEHGHPLVLEEGTYGNAGNYRQPVRVRELRVSN
jgi:hypothetical protein